MKTLLLIIPALLLSTASSAAATAAFSSTAAFIHFAAPSISKSRSVQPRYAQIDPNTDYFTWLGRQVELKIRPKPYQGVRIRMEKDLAVLLMRSSYLVSDDLDFVGMDQFQKAFFRQRQLEWQDYQESYPPLSVRQGELTDPAYFDFISCAQYVTINNEMRDGKLVFVELINADGEKQVVKRDAAFEDNASLPPEHSRRVGDRILTKFMESPEIYAPRTGGNLPYDTLIDSIRRIMDLFTVQKFNQGSKVQILGDKRFQIVSTAPANLWGLQILRFRNEPLTNDFEAKAVMALLRACNTSATYQMDIKDNHVYYTFTLA